MADNYNEGKSEEDLIKYYFLRGNEYDEILVASCVITTT